MRYDACLNATRQSLLDGASVCRVDVFAGSPMHAALACSWNSAVQVFVLVLRSTSRSISTLCLTLVNAFQMNNPRYKSERDAMRASIGEQALSEGLAVVARRSGLKYHIVRYLRDKAGDPTLHRGLFACCVLMDLRTSRAASLLLLGRFALCSFVAVMQAAMEGADTMLCLLTNKQQQSERFRY
jgi:hypothetical protein